MRFLPTKVHGVIDYAWGVLVFVTPWLLGFADGSSAQIVMGVMGVGAFLYSFATDYELGVLPIFPMKGHLAIDFVGGAFLAASPWLFGFADRVMWPHLAFGGFSVVASLITKTRPTKAVRNS